MSIASKLLSYLRKKEEVIESPEGFCPNCWGREEYGGNFYKAVKKENVNISEANANVGWVQDYADKHLSDIRLKHETEGYVCQKCKLTYRPT